MNQIICSDCSTPFEFSDSEQAFYASKQLTPPKRCKACRDQRRSNSGSKGSARGGGFGSDSRGGRNGFSRDRSERPSPSFREPRDGNRYARGNNQSAPRKRFSGNPLPDRSSSETSTPRAKEPRGSAPPRPSKAKAARPMFDMVCASCGAASQVPFQPAPDRDIFCQPCYRSRRKPDGVNLESAAIPPDDSGIIE